MMRRQWLLVALVMLMSGCRESDLCHRDQFFCNAEETWPKLAKHTPTRKLVELHFELRRHYRPGNDVLLNEIGTRGPDAIDSLISYIQNGRMDVYHYDVGPIISSTARYSDYNFCTDDLRKEELARAFEKKYHSRALFVQQNCRNSKLR